MHRFLIVIEKAGKNYSAYSPDLPGCVATRRLCLLDLPVWWPVGPAKPGRWPKSGCTKRSKCTSADLLKTECRSQNPIRLQHLWRYKRNKYLTKIFCTFFHSDFCNVTALQRTPAHPSRSWWGEEWGPGGRFFCGVFTEQYHQSEYFMKNREKIIKLIILWMKKEWNGSAISKKIPL